MLEKSHDGETSSSASPGTATSAGFMETIVMERPMDFASLLASVSETASVRYTTVTQMAHDILQTAIVMGVLAPGERLRQAPLASALGISRMPVRSALLQLETEGLVTLEPRGGAVVRSLTIDDVQEIYDLRSILEGYALKRAVQEMDAERLARLKVLAAGLDSAPEGDQFASLTKEFYRELYGAERHPVLVEFVERLMNEVGRSLLGRRVVHQDRPSHADLMARVGSGDADGAEGWLRDHLNDVRSQLTRLIADGSATGVDGFYESVEGMADVARAGTGEET